MSFKIVATSHAERFEVTGIAGPSLLEQLQAASVPIKSSCQGKGICRQCRVKVTRGIAPVTASDRKAFKEGQLAEGWRLSCGIRPKLAIDVNFPQIYVFQNDVAWLRDPVSDFAWACDFGTTGVEISAVDSEGEFARVKGLNRQVVRGADIMTRLEFAQNNGVDPLRKIADDQISKMLSLLRETITAKKPGAKERAEMTVAGNSAVTSFLANLPIETLAVSPYQPATLAPQMTKLAGLSTKTLPLLNSFVGGDLFAGVFHLWTARKDFEEPWILMDVGTNSEILFFDGEKLVVASTPAGPAFEGSNISIGMRAEAGAIIDPKITNGKWSYEVIGNDLPKGICGSALVQAIDEAVEAGISNADGEILRPELLPFDAETSLNQDDFREFQLAKSAIRTGLDLVRKESKIAPKRLFLAGAFGEHLPLAASCRLGLLPDLETVALGNASLKGVVDWMRAPAEEREEFLNWIEDAKHPIELALSDDFQARFIENLTLRP
ncbi:MAG: DUF4445 domain-containing protein [Bdellovibrionales bacterium]|nr:DUF4445 domain-containing protein [Bdellovibrionales bacterium]